MIKAVLDISSIWLLPLIILLILSWGMVKKVHVYETFVEGAKDGFKIGVSIIPYLVAIMVAVSMFRASGAIDLMGNLFAGILDFLKIPVDVLPVMITRSLSGSAALGLLADITHSSGVDSYAAKLAAVMVGSSETTFYVLAVYFGAVGIKKYRHALLAGVLADILGIIAAIFICRLFFI